jgi:hypothetical protein
MESWIEERRARQRNRELGGGTGSWVEEQGSRQRNREIDRGTESFFFFDYLLELKSAPTIF